MKTRIPGFQPRTFEEMSQWFGHLYSSGLLYHPDDPAETIVRVNSGDRLFSDEEAIKLNQYLAWMFRQFGDGVYEAAYSYFHHWMPGAT